ncbi:MAG: transposase [Terracidiphilus sp.]
MALLLACASAACRWRLACVTISRVLTIRSRGRLPHWEDDPATYFVTFRLADSFPESARRKIEFERQDIIRTARAARRPLSRQEQIRLSRLFRGKIEVRLDAGAGNCWLARPKIANIASDSLTHFDGVRYRLFAWCVMPNHVHVLFQPIDGHDLASIVQAWKSYSAKASNRSLQRSGEF